ncbi:MAG: PaaI family thioesterase [Acidimicrobiales bacterium]|jgi:acyl-CoA thioesterase|nr:PaaI family thioesterase [Acidimicrobiales bacterium]|tara:strand:+ start:12677 stop:13096 length:420 start_codon:yes stop_codon:yes gene_type:complete
MTEPPDPAIRMDDSPLATFLEIGQEAGNGGHTRITLDDRHLSPNGTMHGGALFTMFDSAMGAATRSLLGTDQICVTLEIQVRYLKPIFSGSVEVRAEVLHRGRRIIQLEATATNDGMPVAFATGSFVVLDRTAPTRDAA